MSYIKLILGFFKSSCDAFIKWQEGHKQRQKEDIWNELKVLEQNYASKLADGDAINASIIAKRMCILRKKYTSIAR